MGFIFNSKLKQKRLRPKGELCLFFLINEIDGQGFDLLDITRYNVKFEDKESKINRDQSKFGSYLLPPNFNSNK